MLSSLPTNSGQIDRRCRSHWLLNPKSVSMTDRAAAPLPLPLFRGWKGKTCEAFRVRLAILAGRRGSDVLCVRSQAHVFVQSSSSPCAAPDGNISLSCWSCCCWLAQGQPRSHPSPFPSFCVCVDVDAIRASILVVSALKVFDSRAVH